MTHTTSFSIRFLSSLEKVFPDEPLEASVLSKASMLQNEVFHFQAAYRLENARAMGVQVTVESPLAQWISVRRVDCVPVDLAAYPDADGNILREGKPGLYPDLLRPIGKFGLALYPNQWRCLWLTVEPEKDFPLKPGDYPITLSYYNEEQELLGKAVFWLSVLPAALPPQELIYTNWFHCDCLATWYQAEAFSERHWELIESYLSLAARRGMNMVLTPLFTPPLDTQVGGERPTMQLVGVERGPEGYRFDFSEAERFVKTARRCGITHFEMSHLFTQWGAEHAPKIVAKTPNGTEKIFGWDTDAAGPEYAAFLRGFLPELLHFLKEQGIEDVTYFHVSDEPPLDSLENYRRAKEILEEFISGYHQIDALSSLEFFSTGLVPTPVPGTNDYHLFEDKAVKERWTYYCCAQYKGVSNRFIAMPSPRNRILGIQLYLYRIQGFLHWGYNFWYSRYSLYPINPFIVTDAGGGFQAGDAFVVYPGEEGPLSSLRLEVFYDAFQDMRALTALEGKIGREAVVSLLQEGLDSPITWTEYPTDAAWLLKKREKINRLLAAK